ncbi:hypothetical protein L1887_14491 [Cichorium endivia]|nr:hypothetical protein L1887_14491 [Cichorium endivia]
MQLPTVGRQTERDCKRGCEAEVAGGDWIKDSTMRFVMSLRGFLYLFFVFFFNVIFALSLLSEVLEMEKNGGMFSLLSWSSHKEMIPSIFPIYREYIGGGKRRVLGKPKTSKSFSAIFGRKIRFGVRFVVRSTWGLNFRREKSRLVRPFKGVEEEFRMVDVSRVEYVAPKRESGRRKLELNKE